MILAAIQPLSTDSQAVWAERKLLIHSTFSVPNTNMNCRLCGVSWRGTNSYCPKCGSPAKTERRDWSPLVALISAAAGATVVLLVLGVVRIPSFKSLNAEEKAEIAAIEAEIAQVEHELGECPARQEKLLHQIGDERKNPGLDSSGNLDLQQKFEQSVRLETQLTQRRAELQRKRDAIAKGTQEKRAWN